MFLEIKFIKKNEKEIDIQKEGKIYGNCYQNTKIQPSPWW
jgi:hypothetical protein